VAEHVEAFVATADFGDLDSAIDKSRANYENLKKEVAAFRRTLAKSSKVTEEQAGTLRAMENRLKHAKEAMDGARKSAKGAAKEVGGVGKAAAVAAPGVDKLSAKSKKLAKALSGSDGVGKAAQAAGGRVGELSERSRNLSAAMGTTAGVAAFGALALVGVGLAGIKVAQGVGQGAAALVGLVRQSDELLEATEPFRDLDGFILSGEDIDGLREGKAALDALDTVGAQFGTKLASEIAPAVERVTTLLVAGGLAGLDAFTTMTDGVDFWGQALTRAHNFAVSPSVEGIRLLAEGSIALAEHMGQDVPDGLSAFVNASRPVRITVDEMGQGMAVLEGAAGGYLARAEELIGVQGGVNRDVREGAEAARGAAKATRDAAEATREAAKEAREAAKAWDEYVRSVERQTTALQKIAKISNAATLAVSGDIDKLIAKRDQELSQLDDLTAAAGGGALAEMAAAQAKIAINEKFFADRFELAAAAAEADQQQRAKNDAIELAAFTEKEKQKATVAKATRDAIIAAGTDAANALIDGFSETNRRFLAGQEAQIDAQIAALETKEELTKAEAAALRQLEKEKEKLALFDFRRTKAVAIAKAVLGTAALAITASAPPPAGIGFPAGTIAAGIVGATQIAIIASQRPPKFHDGGVIPGAPGGEVNITALPQESVLTQQVTRDAGGEDGIRQINGGATTLAPNITIILDGEVVTGRVLQHLRGDNAIPPQPSGRNHVGMEAPFG